MDPCCVAVPFLEPYGIGNVVSTFFQWSGNENLQNWIGQDEKGM